MSSPHDDPSTYPKDAVDEKRIPTRVAELGYDGRRPYSTLPRSRHSPAPPRGVSSLSFQSIVKDTSSTSATTLSPTLTDISYGSSRLWEGNGFRSLNHQDLTSVVNKDTISKDKTMSDAAREAKALAFIGSKMFISHLEKKNSVDFYDSSEAESHAELEPEAHARELLTDLDLQRQRNQQRLLDRQQERFRQERHELESASREREERVQAANERHLDTAQKPYPRKGKTRIPKRLVSKRAIADSGYDFIEEGNTIIILKALGQDNIDDLLKLSEDYENLTGMPRDLIDVSLFDK